MDFSLTDDQERYIESFREYLDERNLDAVVAEVEADEFEIGPKGLDFFRELGRDGWLGTSWPVEYGGQGRSAVEEWLFLEELAYRWLPNWSMSVTAIGPTLIRTGSDQQAKEFLPGMLRGEIHFALAYSEPDAGTDLASLRTRAVRDGESFVVNGQKLYTTAAHYATHLWLAVRTDDTSADKRHGISILIVPVDTPGMTIRPIRTQAGGRTNEVFFSDVHVPAANLVGEENGGWRVIRIALDFGRLHPYRRIAKEIEDLVALLDAQEPGRLADDDVARHAVAKLMVDAEVARLYCLRTAAMLAAGEVPHAEASATKVWLSELRQRVSSATLDFLGEDGQIAAGAPGAPFGGRIERRYRAGPLLRFGGGTNELQRTIIARYALGLPG